MLKKRLQKILLLKSKNLVALLILVLVGIILTGTVNSATYNCSSCSDCSTKIQGASSGDIIYLNTSIDNQNSDCIVFNGQDDVIFDCQEYYIEGDSDDSGYGIKSTAVGGGDNNTIRNCNLTKFQYGIYLKYCDNNTLINITASNNSDSYSGIYLRQSNNNTFTNVTTNNNGYGIRLDTDANNNIFSDITANNNSYYGIYIYSNLNNTFTDVTANNNSYYGIEIKTSSSNTFTNITANNNFQFGIEITTSSSNNTFTNIIIQENGYNDLEVYIPSSDSYCNNNFINITGSGNKPIEYYNYTATIENKELSELILCNADSSTINNVTINGSSTVKNNGLYLLRTNYSVVSNITSSENYNGIYFGYSSNNNLINITTNSNEQYGIYLILSDYNTISNSHIENNTEYGIYFDSPAAYNPIYNNFFNNTINYYILQSSPINFFNTTKASGTNIMGGSYIGGNYWAYPNGTGFSDTCADADNDGICTSAYSLDGLNYDYLPLAGGVCTESWTCTSWSTCSGGTQIRTCTDANSCGTETNKPTESQTCTSGGGGNGGGITEDQPIQSFSWNIIEPGTPAEMEITNPEIDLTKITVNVLETITDVSIEITKIDVVPHADMKIGIGGKTYQSFKIETIGINDTNIESVIIGFKVNKTWISEQGGSAGDIKLYRGGEKVNVWNELQTTLIDSDSDYYYFSAASSSFSIFVVVIDLSRCNNNNICETELGENEMNCPNDCKVVAEKKGFFDIIKSYLWIGIIIILVLMIIMVLVVLVIRLKRNERLKQMMEK